MSNLPWNIHWQGIYGMILRYVYLYTRNGLRLFELFFWPINHLLVWGFLTRYLLQAGEGGSSIPVTFLLGGVLLWDVQFRATQGVSVSLLEDVWVRNLLNVFVAPLRTMEIVVGYCVVGVLRILITVPLLTLGAYLAFSFNILDFSPWLVPFYANLLLFGWSLGLLANALILRWGQAAEGMAWAVPFLVQPFCAIYYTLETLPGWMQWISMAFPVTHVFEAMRAALSGEVHLWQGLGLAFLLNFFWLLLAGAMLFRVLRISREKGLLTKIGTQ
ncbi:MAG: ABC transporter permease [Verrucomicrobiota bacterium]